jgi:periplasmic divalent cation tolerance protein
MAERTEARVDTDVVQVAVTVDDAGVAERIGAALVADGLVACAQVGGPIRSTYRWQGGIETAEEHQLVLKTTSASAAAVVAAVRAAHPYETPEVLVTPVIGGDPDYLSWVVDACAGS